MDKIQNQEENYITTTELCEWLKISKATASNWRNQGMPYIGKTRAYRYKKSDILKWLEKQKK